MEGSIRIVACRGSGASERELEALAIYMGHSLEMQRGSYDRQGSMHRIL